MIEEGSNATSDWLDRTRGNAETPEASGQHDRGSV